ncbi:unnamed protein product [Phytophthora fragariaefolia]|uniref:Unnamed protein product n=1 Tax=Phytophthora fragariaefolia TaxID=1490495 RepID=A0A9W6UAN8_9STRA|nr:unnamed protein product [Phytophthora fragariaefolia]
MTLETDDGSVVAMDMEDIRPSTGGTSTGTGTGERSISVSSGNTESGSAARQGATNVAETKNRRAVATNLVTVLQERVLVRVGREQVTRVQDVRRRRRTRGTRARDSTWAYESAPARSIVVHEKVKELKLTKFRGLDDSMWLKTVRAEVRRHSVTMGVIWSDKQLFHEVAAHIEGEAQRWFATVMETVPEVHENINSLADLLRAKYMAQSTSPEVVDLLNVRRQTRGERLVEYAQALREIGEGGETSEEWLVNAFLKGMNSGEGATHVRGHRLQTLDDAGSLAAPHVGEYGKGYGVGLEAAMTRWDEAPSLCHIMRFFPVGGGAAAFFIALPAHRNTACHTQRC